MKITYLVLPLLLLGACGDKNKEKNPRCITEINEIQVFQVVKKDNKVSGLAFACSMTQPDNGNCLGMPVRIPYGLFDSLEEDQKITPPAGKCFIFEKKTYDKGWEYISVDGKLRRVPVINLEYVYDITHDLGYKIHYEDVLAECVSKSTEELKSSDLNVEDVCKCYTDYLMPNAREILQMKASKEREEKGGAFHKEFCATVGSKCGTMLTFIKKWCE